MAAFSLFLGYALAQLQRMSEIDRANARSTEVGSPPARRTCHVRLHCDSVRQSRAPGQPPADSGILAACPAIPEFAMSRYFSPWMLLLLAACTSGAGVDQRAALLKKGGSGLIPHFLSMSATPIPRTIMMTVFMVILIILVRQLSLLTFCIRVRVRI